MSSISEFLPFSASTTTPQALSYLFGISLFSISFLVFLNSSVSFVVTDLIGQKDGVGDVVGTLGFADEVVALVACPVWGLLSDRLGVRWVAVLGYLIIGAALALFVQARNVYPDLLFARIFFAVGASAAATMVTAILPSLTDETEQKPHHHVPKRRRATRVSDLSLESDVTITPERYSNASASASASIYSDGDGEEEEEEEEERRLGRPSALAGYVGVFTGCGALVALSLFLPLPAWFGELDGVSTGDAVRYSYYVVALVALGVGGFVFLGLEGLRGEEGKGWGALLGGRRDEATELPEDGDDSPQQPVLPYLHLLREAVTLGFTDSNIALGYLGGFVARASTVAISLFIPLFVNTYFIGNGFCHGSPHDPSPELKKECRAAYVLASILSGVAQLLGLICAPAFGYFSSRLRRRSGGSNVPVQVAAVLGIVGYLAFPRLRSPEFKDVEGRGGGPVVLLLVALMGVSQIGAIVCSLGSLGRGVLSEDSAPARGGGEGRDGSCGEDTALLGRSRPAARDVRTRVALKGSVAGVYSWCGGAAILLLTKLGGYLFDSVGGGAPFYMMALFNGIWLAASLGIDMGREFRSHARGRSSP
ncbi:related to MFS transporter [Cephalotrichum gorgonifer]|uniref:Related to MFS transporter n=1 Tax=Cephalotrichum gorgonifer TaxID=2041049 RepID=A0AAE8MQW7_9PEZI|nr:related to MFS transporter [Cephalotrichum gorgonifer]